MHYESLSTGEHYKKDDEVEAYGFNWTVEEVDIKGRYTLRFNQWSLYGVDPILVTKKKTNRQ